MCGIRYTWNGALCVWSAEIHCMLRPKVYMVWRYNLCVGAEHCVFERCVVHLVWNTVHLGPANTVYSKRNIV